MLYPFLESHGVPFRRCGKLVVATDEAEMAAIEGVARKGAVNGCDDLHMITGEQAMALEAKASASGTASGSSDATNESSNDAADLAALELGDALL